MTFIESIKVLSGRLAIRKACRVTQPESNEQGRLVPLFETLVPRLCFANNMNYGGVGITGIELVEPINIGEETAATNVGSVIDVLTVKP